MFMATFVENHIQNKIQIKTLTTNGTEIDAPISKSFSSISKTKRS